jgi:hypothetical protein
MTLHQLQRISGLVEDVIASAPPKHPKARRLVRRLADLDQVIAAKKSREGKTI